MTTETAEADQGANYVGNLRAIALGELGLTNLLEAATALSAAGRNIQATNLYRAWTKANSNHPLVHVALFNGAVQESGIGEHDAAIESLKKAIAHAPDFLPAYINLGAALERVGQPGQAVEIWRSALARPATLNSASVTYATTLLKQIARVFGDQSMHDMAEQAIVHCLGLAPSQRDAIEQYVAFRMAQCKWPVMETIENVEPAEIIKKIHPLSAAVYTDDPIFQLAVAERYVRETCRPTAVAGPHDRRAAHLDLSDRRIKVGYVSSDLRDHAVGYLMAELFERHDRTAIEVFAYYCGAPSQSDLTKRIQGSVEHWRDIRAMTNEAAASLVAMDGIDVLVDVNGHTRDARLGLFALRPAPIQVNWLGFPGTMGSPFHHYIIADDWIIPEASEKYYSERVVRIPCYQPNDRRREVGPAPSREDVGLPENAFVYCSFNGTHKISKFTFERWMEILRSVPNSVLWLLDAQASVQDRLRSAASARGVEGARLVFAPRLKNSFHLARFPLADAFLDTAPYGAHTTASDALWMGLPVVTFSGRGFASRVCGSLVRAAGLPELVAESPAAFVQTAIDLGKNPARAKALRERLIENRGSCLLFDTDLLARRLEDQYRAMCLEYQGRALPKPDLRNLETYLDIGAGLPHEVQETSNVQDLDGLYRSALASRHMMRPLPADRRIWTQDAIDEAERQFARDLAMSKSNEVNLRSPLIKRSA